MNIFVNTLLITTISSTFISICRRHRCW